MNWRWPQTNNNSFMNPWWVILRRMAFLPLAWVGAAILWLALLFGWGAYEAERFRKENF